LREEDGVRGRRRSANECEGAVEQKGEKGAMLEEEEVRDNNTRTKLFFHFTCGGQLEIMEV